MSPEQSGSLTPLQITAIRIFFGLDQSHAFLLVGGAALIAHGIVERTTRDLDFFDVTGRVDVPIGAIAQEFAQACTHAGLDAKVMRDLGTFANVRIGDGQEQIDVDIAIDGALPHEPLLSPVGMTPALVDLAGMKMLALFHRAAPRDFVDVFALANLLSKTSVLDSAANLDSGFDLPALRDALRRIHVLPEDRLPATPEQVAEMRAFFRQWEEELT